MRPAPVCPCGTCHSCRHRDSKRRHAAERRAAGFKLDPRVRRAHNAVAFAKKNGSLVPEPCACGCETPLDLLEAHHEDYDRPLDVIWACVKEHRRLDRLLREREQIAA